MKIIALVSYPVDAILLNVFGRRKVSSIDDGYNLVKMVPESCGDEL